MLRYLLALTTIPLLVLSNAWAQPPAPTDHSHAAPPQPPQAGHVPDTTSYARAYRQDTDARLAVRRKSEYRAAQRMNRIAALQWYGLSNSRPAASATPWMSQYSPTWTSNTRKPFAWSGAARSTTVIIYPPQAYLR
jgi:hypothetical protein